MCFDTEEIKKRRNRAHIGPQVQHHQRVMIRDDSIDDGTDHGHMITQMGASYMQESAD